MQTCRMETKTTLLTNIPLEKNTVSSYLAFTYGDKSDTDAEGRMSSLNLIAKDALAGKINGIRQS